MGWLNYGEGREMDRSCTINSFAHRCSCIHICAVEAMCSSQACMEMLLSYCLRLITNRLLFLCGGNEYK